MSQPRKTSDRRRPETWHPPRSLNGSQKRPAGEDGAAALANQPSTMVPPDTPVPAPGIGAGNARLAAVDADTVHGDDAALAAAKFTDNAVVEYCSDQFNRVVEDERAQSKWCEREDMLSAIYKHILGETDHLHWYSVGNMTQGRITEWKIYGWLMEGMGCSPVYLFV